MHTRPLLFALVLSSLVLPVVTTGCTDREGKPLFSLRRATPDSAAVPAADTLAATDTASAFGTYETLSPAELERGRMDEGWKRFVRLDDDAASTGAAARTTEQWQDLSAARVNAARMALPLYGDVGGPSVLRTQVLLDRARFSPGILDGRWGKNTESALYWLQRREGLKATGRLDSTTYRRLLALAGSPDSLVVRYRLRPEDVQGPFRELPDDIYERAEMERMFYTSLTEQLSETFHVTPELLAKLNPGVRLDSLKAGETVHVPNVTASNAQTGDAGGQVAGLRISDGGHYLHAVDAAGRVLYHFPTTLGGAYTPSSAESLRVVSITPDPWWHYQPSLLVDVPDTARTARIPPGPNNAVGTVWMALSKPHYGIHGTSAPETIGYATSSGCVRLTNWDARFLADRIRPGISVQFLDVTDDERRPSTAPDTSAQAARHTAATPPPHGAAPAAPRRSG